MSHYIAVSDKPSISIVNISMIEERIDSKYYTNFNLSIIKRILDSGLLVKSLNELSRKITQGPNPKFIEDKRGIPCLKTRNIYDDEITFEGCNYISESEYKNLERFKILYGDILIAIQGEGSIGKSNIYTKKEKAVFSRPIGLVRVKDSIVDPFYLSAFLRSFYGKRLLERGISGSSGQLVLAVEYIKTIPIPLPNESIQNYIGNKVRKAEELREEAKQLMSQVYELINIHFSLDSFENEIKDNYKYDFVSSNYLEDRLDAEYYDPNLIKLFTHLSKMGFKFVNLGNVSRMVFTGENVESTWIAPNKKVPLIYIGNLEGYFVIPSDSEFIDENNVRNWEKSFAEFGDILFASRGSLDCLINRISVYFDEDKKGVITSNIIAVRLDQNLIRPGYVISVLKSIIGTYQIIKHSWGVAQKGLTANDVSKIVIPLLQINEQLEIEEKLIQSFKKLQEAKKLINEAKQDVEDLIEGKFDESKISEGV